MHVVLFDNKRYVEFLLCLGQCIFKDLSDRKDHRDYIRLLPILGLFKLYALTKVIVFYSQDICLTHCFLI